MSAVTPGTGVDYVGALFPLSTRDANLMDIFDKSVLSYEFHDINTISMLYRSRSMAMHVTRHCRGVDPVLNVGGRGTNLYIHIYVCIIYIYIYI